MGELILLQQRRAVRARPTPDAGPAFFFDVGCPLSYLAAEHIERSFGDVAWVPVSATALRGPLNDADRDELRRRAEVQAAELRMPLVWPDTFPADAPCALRAAMFAAELRAGPRFALAAGRLAFCGGFDLDDPETIAEAAAAAAIPLGACLEAAGDTRRDLALKTTATGLRARGVRELPVLRAGGQWFAGPSGWRVASTVLPTGDGVTASAASGGGGQSEASKASGASATITAFPFSSRAGTAPLAPAG